jgi:uncharacterized membrane protein (GlpM family)
VTAGALVVRFVIGGVVVSLFSAIGEVAKPQTFAGIFGAAPSVALATLGLALAHGDTASIAVEARWFAIACVAMLAYCSTCVVLTARMRTAEWHIASGAWLAWLATAAALHAGVRLLAGS